jgi:hypothetical protein
VAKKREEKKKVIQFVGNTPIEISKKILTIQVYQNNHKIFPFFM